MFYLSADSSDSVHVLSFVLVHRKSGGRSGLYLMIAEKMLIIEPWYESQ
jgi:hypothetical protein